MTYASKFGVTWQRPGHEPRLLLTFRPIIQASGHAVVMVTQCGVAIQVWNN